MSDRFSEIIATGAGAGYLPIAPGTWGSAEALLIAALLLLGFPTDARWIIAGLTLLAVAVGIPAATQVSRRAGKDPSKVVIDEIAGQWLTLLWIPLSPFSLVAGFFLFRLFDIIKPFPARRSEDLPEGLGIMVDDLIAGAYAGIGLWLLRWLGF